MNWEGWEKIRGVMMQGESEEKKSWKFNNVKEKVGPGEKRTSVTQKKQMSS